MLVCFCFTLLRSNCLSQVIQLIKISMFALYLRWRLDNRIWWRRTKALTWKQNASWWSRWFKYNLKDTILVREDFDSEFLFSVILEETLFSASTSQTCLLGAWGSIDCQSSRVLGAVNCGLQQPLTDISVLGLALQLCPFVTLTDSMCTVSNSLDKAKKQIHCLAEN